MAKRKERGKMTPSDDAPQTGGTGRSKKATRYTSPTGKKVASAARRRQAVSGGPRRGGRAKRAA